MKTEEIEEAVMEHTQSYLSFRLDEEFFALNVQHVIEILEVPKITRVPHAPAYMAGVINLRGKVLPLVDTKVKFGLEPVQYTVNTCVIVVDIEVEGEKIQIGTLVDAVLEVMEIGVSQIQPSPTIQARYKLEFIEGVFRKEEDFIMLLNLGKVFSIEEMNEMQDSNEQADKKDI